MDADNKSPTDFTEKFSKLEKSSKSKFSSNIHNKEIGLLFSSMVLKKYVHSKVAYFGFKIIFVYQYPLIIH